MMASFASLRISLSLYAKPASVSRAGQSYQQWRHYAKKKKQTRTSVNLLTEEEAELIGLDGMKNDMSKVMDSLKWEYTNVVTSKLNPSVVGNLELKDRRVKISDVGHITMPNPHTILINFSAQPSYMQEAASILRAKINLNPSVEGQVIRASVPRPSKESRDGLSKEAKKCADNAKIRVRRVRQTAISSLRKQKEAVSKDTMGKLEGYIQSLSDEHIGIIEDLLKSKNSDIQKQ